MQFVTPAEIRTALITQQLDLPVFEANAIEDWFRNLVHSESSWYPWDKMYKMLTERMEVGPIEGYDYWTFENMYKLRKERFS